MFKKITSIIASALVATSMMFTPAFASPASNYWDGGRFVETVNITVDQMNVTQIGANVEVLALRADGTADVSIKFTLLVPGIVPATTMSAPVTIMNTVEFNATGTMKPGGRIKFQTVATPDQPDVIFGQIIRNSMGARVVVNGHVDVILKKM